MQEHVLVQFEAVQRTVSAACLPEDTIMGLRAGPGSTVPLDFISYETDYRPEGRAELVCHVRGEAEDLDKAGEVLTNSGIRNLQLLAVAANAAVLSPHIQLVYEPRSGGQFRVLRTLGDEPQVARRTIDVERTIGLIQAFDHHPKETRLLRAAANYGEALRRTGAVSSVHAILHLWMAVENLTVVVADRLLREYNVSGLGELGTALGVRPRGDRVLPDDRDVNGFLRRRDASEETMRRTEPSVKPATESNMDTRASEKQGSSAQRSLTQPRQLYVAPSSASAASRMPT